MTGEQVKVSWKLDSISSTSANECKGIYWIGSHAHMQTWHISIDKSQQPLVLEAQNDLEWLL